MAKYKDLAEMFASPEYKRLVSLIRKGVKEGILDTYPPLPLPEEERCDEPGCFLPKGHEELHRVMARIYDIEED